MYRLRLLMRRLAPAIMQRIEQAEYAEQWVYPIPSGQSEYYRTDRRLRMEGITLNIEEQIATLQKWRSDAQHRDLHDAIRNDPTINVPTSWGNFLGRGVIQNGFYPSPDAEIYASMIREFRPAQIIEVGSGFSTLIARRAIAHAGLQTKIIVVDPEPRTSVAHAADRIVTSLVEHSGLLGRVDWSLPTLLFIDSSHVCRARGDLPYLYCDLIPSLPPGVLVHVHDIFLPFDYPTNYDRYLYTEQFLLHCLLAHSPRYHVVLSAQILSRDHLDEIQATFGPAVGEKPIFAGASFWFRIKRLFPEVAYDPKNPRQDAGGKGAESN